MSNKIQLQTNNSALDALITRVNAAKDVAASLPEAAGGGNNEVATCTIEIVNETINSFPSYLNELWFVAYENGEYVGYGGCLSYDYGNKLPTGFDWESERNVLNNVVCGSMMMICDTEGSMECEGVTYINLGVDYRYIFIPPTPNVTYTFKIVDILGGGV